MEGIIPPKKCKSQVLLLYLKKKKKKNYLESIYIMSVESAYVDKT